VGFKAMSIQKDQVSSGGNKWAQSALSNN